MCSFETGREPRGAALIISMLIMAVLLLAGTTFLTISSTESQIALNEQVSTQALSLAEAGLHRAIAILSENSSYAGTGGTPISIGSGSATIAVAVAINQICATAVAKEVTVTGSVPVGGGQAQAQVKVIVDKISYPFRWAAFSAIRNGVLGTYYDPNRNQWDNRTDSEIWLRNNSTVDVFDSSRGAYGGGNSGLPGGRIGAFGDIQLDSGTRIKGGVIAGDGLFATGATIDAFGLSLQTRPFEAFVSLVPPPPPSTPGPITLSGSYVIGAGTYHYTTVTIANNSSIVFSGQATVYITGDVSIGNNVTLGSSPATNLRIVTKSDGGDTDLAKFKAGNDFVFRGALYGRNTDVFLGDRAQVYGSIIGRTILAGDDSQIHYDQAMARQPICSGSGNTYTIRRGTWREIVP